MSALEIVETQSVIHSWDLLKRLPLLSMPPLLAMRSITTIVTNPMQEGLCHLEGATTLSLQ